MSVTQDQRDTLDGILLFAEQNALTLLAAKNKATGKDTALLCCPHVVDGSVKLVPVAEIILGDDINARYIVADKTHLVS